MVHSGHLLSKPLLTLFKCVSKVPCGRFHAVSRTRQKTEWHYPKWKWKSADWVEPSLGIKVH